jgi:hypothetical protein
MEYEGKLKAERIGRSVRVPVGEFKRVFHVDWDDLQSESE